MSISKTAYLVAAIALVPACGGETVTDAGLDAPRDVGTMTDAGVDAGDLDGGPVDAPTDVPAGDAGPTGFAITNIQVTGGCMPIVPPDSVGVSWDTVITAGSAGTAVATGHIRLLAPDGSTAEQDFMVMPTPLAFGAGTTTIASSKGLGTPAIDVCSTFCASATANVEITVDFGLGDVQVHNMTGIPVDCVF